MPRNIFRPEQEEEELRQNVNSSAPDPTLELTASKAPLFGAFRRMPEQGSTRIGEKEIAKAAEILAKYKAGKANLETRVVQDELWWELRHWEVIRSRSRSSDPAERGPEPASAWLFNAIINKHADAMDNFPESLILPREQSDEQSAKTLSSILPVVMESNDFNDVYSEQWWEKLKHGSAVYGVFWNPKKDNGLGDIDIHGIDLLNIFWEPGITDIQKSRNLFIVDLVDEDLLDQQYPEHAGKMGGTNIDVKSYIYDDTVDTAGKSLVVDWYYKVATPAGKTVLHYAKFVGSTLLYASENDPEYADRGWYDHGQYPVVIDTLFPEKGTPIGYGFVAVCKDPQLYIDNLQANILENAMMATKKRYFMGVNTNINEEEFLDWSRPIVHVEGELSDRSIQEIDVQSLPAIYLDIMQLKVEELKETAANRDVNSGGASSGITAAAAISALQEAGNKNSRDMINSTYRAYSKITSLCIELIRQFYDESRAFRVIGPGGWNDYQFIQFNNAGIKDQPMDDIAGTGELFRRPVFDIKVASQKKNPFSRMEQNQRAQELYQMGFFNPERAQEAQACLEMMDFEGIDKAKEFVQQGQTLMNICEQQSQQIAQLTAILSASGILPGGPAGPGQPAPQGQGAPQQQQRAGGQTIQSAVDQAAKRNMTSYGERLAKRSTPDVSQTSDSARPGGV